MYGEEWLVVFGVVLWFEMVWMYLILNVVEYGGVLLLVEFSWDEIEME